MMPGTFSVGKLCRRHHWADKKQGTFELCRRTSSNSLALFQFENFASLTDVLTNIGKEECLSHVAVLPCMAGGLLRARSIPLRVQPPCLLPASVRPQSDGGREHDLFALIWADRRGE